MGNRTDPWPYDGPIERADGRRPFNRYLWPTERWVFEHETGILSDFMMRIEVVWLADGRFATSGFVHDIEQHIDSKGQRCVFADRSVAIRASAARMIRLCRAAVRHGFGWTGLHRAPEIITWAREVVARETGSETPKAIAFQMPKPRPAPTGLPLFDMEIANG